MILLALLLFASFASAQEQPRTFRIPFHTVNSLILLDATVNGSPVVLVLDTGAMQTQLDRKVLVVAQHTEYSILYVDLKMEGYHLPDFRILATDLTKILKPIPHAQGILGEDWMRTFSSVRIDYEKSVITLEARQ